MHDFYGSDLARIHDEGFTDLVESAAAFVVDLLSKRGIEQGCVLDLSCGGGQLSAARAERGYEAWAVDVSEPMVARARVRVPTATFVRRSLTEVPLPRCVAAGQPIGIGGLRPS